MSQKILILTVGLPRSGKSSWARAMNLPIVNPDSIRKVLHGEAFIPEAEPMVWTLARYMVAALFEAGHDIVILDACNVTRKRRLEWRDPRWTVYCQEFATPALTCRVRALRGSRYDLLPVIDRMAEQREGLDSSASETGEELRWPVSIGYGPGNVPDAEFNGGTYDAE